jgi:hypothetical protein
MRIRSWRAGRDHSQELPGSRAEVVLQARGPQKALIHSTMAPWFLRTCPDIAPPNDAVRQEEEPGGDLVPASKSGAVVLPSAATEPAHMRAAGA